MANARILGDIEPAKEPKEPTEVRGSTQCSLSIASARLQCGFSAASARLQCRFSAASARLQRRFSAQLHFLVLSCFMILSTCASGAFSCFAFLSSGQISAFL